MTCAPTAPATPRRPGSRLQALDATRFAAALAVVLYHWTSWHHGEWDGGDTVALEIWPVLGRLSSLGSLGVQLFFMVSGFVILLSALGRSPARYLGSRVGRLYPAYWVAVLLAGLLLFVLWPEAGEGRSPVQILTNLTMLQGALGGGQPHLDGVYWTLWIELKFYATVLALLLLRWTTPVRLLAFAVLWPLFGTALWWAARGHAQASSTVSHWLFPEYSALFAVGIALFLVHRHGGTPTRWAAVAVTAVLAVAWSTRIQVRETMATTGLVVPWWVVAGVGTAMVVWVAVATVGPAARWHVPGAAAAGALTYPLYLHHQLWGWWLIGRLTPILGPRPTLIVTLALVLVWSAFVHRWVERPLGPRLREGASRLFERVPGLGADPLRPGVPTPPSGPSDGAGGRPV